MQFHWAIIIAFQNQGLQTKGMIIAPIINSWAIIIAFQNQGLQTKGMMIAPIINSSAIIVPANTLLKALNRRGATCRLKRRRAKLDDSNAVRLGVQRPRPLRHDRPTFNSVIAKGEP